MTISGKDAQPMLVSMRDFMAPSTTPKIQVVAAKPNLLQQLAGGSSSPKPATEKPAPKYVFIVVQM